MNTNDVCKSLNVTLKSLRVYEECGIVVPKREENNYRNYSENDLFKLRTVILLKELGLFENYFEISIFLIWMNVIYRYGGQIYKVFNLLYNKS